MIAKRYVLFVLFFLFCCGLKRKKRYQKKEKQRNSFLRSCEREFKWLLQAEPALLRSLLLCLRITRSRRKGLLVLTVAEPSERLLARGNVRVHLQQPFELMLVRALETTKFLLFCFVFSSFVFQRRKNEEIIKSTLPNPLVCRR